ncbi:hypothetical protein [Endothiovibrio diazotrophicus]
MESDLHKAALIHENVHYLQAVTGFFGIYRFMAMWQSLSFLAKLRSAREAAELNADEIAGLQREHAQNQDKLAIFQPYPSIDVPADGFEGEGEEGPRWVEMPDDRHQGAYCKVLPNGDRRLIFFDIVTLQESMAMALEQWYGFNPDVYAKARASADPQLFIYAAGAEAVRELTGWGDSEAVWWVTYALCEYALNHPTPNHVFFHGARLAGQQWPEAPGVEELENLYTLLVAQFEFEEVEQIRADVFSHVTERLKKRRPQEESDHFDAAVYSLLDVMDAAIRLRRQRPHVFALFPLRDPSNEYFLEHFHMPVFSTGEAISRLCTDPNRSHGVLFMVAAFHRLFSLVAPEHNPAECPFAHLDACQVERTPECYSAPWRKGSAMRPSQELCLYGFVDHGFELLPRNG